MIDKIEITGSNYKPTESFQKYTKKRLGKLDRYMPRGYKKDIVMKVIVTEVDRSHGNKYEISAGGRSVGSEASRPGWRAFTMTAAGRPAPRPGRPRWPAAWHGSSGRYRRDWA